MTDPTPAARTRSRLTLLLVAALFVLPFAIAFVMYRGHWQPARTKNRGELLQPVRDLRDVHFTRADGRPFAWRHEEHTWRVLVAPPAGCADACERLADRLQRIWTGLGRNAVHVEVLWVGPPPRTGFGALVPVTADATLATRLPDVATRDAIPAYVVDPSGYLILRYAPTSDPGDLRRDLAQLLQWGE